ncbi:MAG: dienelactone hydrolase family protein [Nocardioidaceae bacterium]
MTEIELTELSSDVGGSQPLHGYLATPTGDGPWPGVVVVHEAFGLDQVMRRQVDRLASAGFLALAPDLFSAGGARRCLVSTMRAMMAGEGSAFADIAAAKSALRRSGDCTGKIGIIGFCMGGGFALLSASHGYDAASPNYGMLPKDLDAALADACPLVASYGGRDLGLRGAAGKLTNALTRAGVVHDVKEYPRAGHAFLNDAPTGPKALRPLMRVAHIGPEPESAADAWRRIDAFFSLHLR